eukprot:scaffold14717_cov168-Ochromonas_danica.AAC.18
MTTTTTTEIRKKRSSTTAPLRNKRLAEWEVLANSPAIKEALKLLPANYDFEIPKTIWKILSLQAQTILMIPQVKPLSRGETLGCTAPSLSPESDLFIFLADGRFHMEAAMIRNPHIPAYRYDPYNKVMSLEKYDLPRMISIREQAIRKAKEARLFGVILGTLGHQGNPKILSRLKALLDKQGRRYVTFLMAEAWIQISCPRLSMDWGAESDRPLLNVYEAMVALEGAPWDGKSYPMDYYSNEKSVWSNYH